MAYKAALRVWRGDAGAGELADYQVEVNDGEVVLDLEDAVVPERKRGALEMAIAGAPKPADLITAASVRNAMIVLQAIGGSTNGLIHLTAIAGRAGVKIDLDAFDRLSREVPVLLTCVSWPRCSISMRPASPAAPSATPSPRRKRCRDRM